MAGVTPSGYLTIPEAIGVLLQSRFAGVELSARVATMRSVGVVDAVGSDELQETTAYFWSEVDRGKLLIWAVHPSVETRVRIDPLLLVPILRHRGGLAYLRSMHQLSDVLSERFGKSFRRAQLLVTEDDLKRADRNLRRLRKRKQLRPPPEKARGRPTKVPAAKSAIIEIVRTRKWQAPQSLKTLALLVSRPPYKLSVREHTVARALDELYQDTGDRQYERMRKGSKQANALSA